MKLDQFEIENIEDCLEDFEKYFKIKFENSETEKLENFEEFCDLAISKMDFENIETCTYQQAFYKFREKIIEEKIVERNSLTPNTELKNIFPRKNRRKQIEKLEEKFGFKFGILGVPQIIINIIVIFLGISIFILLFNWKFGLLGVFTSIFAVYLTTFGKGLHVNTVRDLIEKISAENYLTIRTEKNTVNKSELRTIIINWFAENAAIEKEKLKTGTFA